MNHPMPLTIAARRTLGLAMAGALLALTACSNMGWSDDASSTPPPFAPGWQEHTTALFNLGPGPTAGTTVYMVPGLLPRGRYEVISRQGERARLLDGHRFEVDGSVNKEIRLILPFASGSIEALDERYVLSQATPKKATP
jgi:hypothetical protein